MDTLDRCNLKNRIPWPGASWPGASWPINRSLWSIALEEVRKSTVFIFDDAYVLEDYLIDKDITYPEWLTQMAANARGSLETMRMQWLRPLNTRTAQALPRLQRIYPRVFIDDPYYELPRGPDGAFAGSGLGSFGEDVKFA